MIKQREEQFFQVRGNGKLCSNCGKQETSNWVRHWEKWHQIRDPERRTLLLTGQEPQEPWCSNWREVIDHKVSPKDILLQYQKFYRHGKSIKNSIAESQASGLEESEIRHQDFSHLNEDEKIPKKYLPIVPEYPNQPLNQIKVVSDDGEEQMGKDTKDKIKFLNKLDKDNIKVNTTISSSSSIKLNQCKIQFNRMGSASSKSEMQLEQIKTNLIHTEGWKQALKRFTTSNFNEFLINSKDFAISFLILGGQYKVSNSEFLSQLLFTLEYITLDKVPQSILSQYEYLFELPNLTEQFKDVKQLRLLLEFANKIHAGMSWLENLENPLRVIIDVTWLGKDCQVSVATILCQQSDFYSSQYFEVIRQVSLDVDTCICIEQTVADFFSLIRLQKEIDYMVDEEIMLSYTGLHNRFGFETLKLQTEELLQIAGQALANRQLLDMLKLANTKNYESVKNLATQLAPEFSFEDLTDLLFVRENDMKEQQLQLQQDQRNQMEEEDRLARKIQQNAKQEEIKIQQEKKAKMLSRDLLVKIFQEYQFLNGTSYNIEDLFVFERIIQELAGKIEFELDGEVIKIKLREEQIIIMFYLLKSTSRITFVELQTGFGKSLMGALMIMYYHMTEKSDAVNVVPSEELRLDQIRLYCPSVCRAGNDLFYDDADKAYYYYTFTKILSIGKPLLQALAVIDEPHAFLKEPARVIETGVNSPYQFVQKHQYKIHTESGRNSQKKSNQQRN